MRPSGASSRTIYSNKRNALNNEPDWTALSASTPANIRTLLRRCLHKDANHHLHDIADARIEIEEILAVPTMVEPREQPTRLGWSRRTAWSLVLLLFLALALTLLIPRFRSAPAAPVSMRFSISAPENAVFAAATSVAVSPDGSQLAFTANADGKQLLWVRPLGSLTARSLPGTEGAVNPFWSPDGQYLGFFSYLKLYKIPVAGGAAQPLADTVGPGTARIGTWNREGTIVFTSRITRVPLYRVSASGGQPAPVTTLDQSRQETGHAFPSFLPDGHHFLYFRLSARLENNGVMVGSLDSPETKFLLQADSGAMYAPPGYLLFMRGDTLTAQAFDTDRLALSGEPFPVAEVARNDANGAPSFSPSENGILVYRNERQDSQLVWMDRVGAQVGSVGPPGAYSNPALSPDGRRVVVDALDPHRVSRDLWLYDLSRGTTSRLTFGPAEDSDAVWSPDGEQIVFGSSRAGSHGLKRTVASGAGMEETLVQTTASTFPRDWSSDGRFVLYEVWEPQGLSDLWVLPFFGDRKPTPFLQTEFGETAGRFSPNGRWIAYTSNESGRYEIYVQSFPVSAAKWQISAHGGYNPRWNRNGKELFYIAADGKLMAVPVTADAAFEVGVPKALFQTPFVGLVPPFIYRSHYDVSPDAQRFLLNIPTGERSAAPITVVLNWFEELKRRVPAP